MTSTSWKPVQTLRHAYTCCMLLVRPGAPSSFLLLLVRHLLLLAWHLFLVAYMLHHYPIQESVAFILRSRMDNHRDSRSQSVNCIAQRHR